jgi:hypothetical protein
VRAGWRSAPERGLRSPAVTRCDLEASWPSRRSHARHRALALHDDHIELHAELIAAEVAHQLAMTRDALRRNPPLRHVG